jgi:hypothetical protein
MLGQHVGQEALRRRARLLQDIVANSITADRIYRDRIGVDLYRLEGRYRALDCV